MEITVPLAMASQRLDALSRQIDLLAESVYSQRRACLDLEVTRFPLHPQPPAALARAKWRRIALGDRWGERQGEYWFRTRLVVPEEWANQPVELVLQLGPEGDVSGPEALVYVNGRKAASADRYHRSVPIVDSAQPSELYEVIAAAYCGHHDKDHALFAAEWVTVDREAQALYYDLRVAADWLRDVPVDPGTAELGLSALTRALDLLGPTGGQPLRPQRVLAAREHLRQSIYEASPFAAAGLTGDGQARPAVHLIGHSHIDVAWFWTVRQVRFKCLRTFSNVERLMARYPEFRFTQSQPQLYAFVKQDAPELYERIRARVAEGRWETIGNTWVEPDCNLPSGESLVRQFLLGRRFFRREFGTVSPVMWMPDAFGYTASLPQIIHRSGARYFMTTKLSWNDTNRMPHDTFLWRGIDGSEVLTHFVTTPCDGRWTTYNGEVTPGYVRGCWEDYRDKEVNDEVLFAFGWGDGGGGPTEAMLETAARLEKLPGLPTIHQAPAAEFFRRLEARRPRLPVWDGELYLEFHRGTYTSQARNKRYNRQCEHLYHNAELFSAMAWLDGARYPSEDLERGWEIILRNQFHDILPGSSVGDVYQESEETYREARLLGTKALETALDHLASHLATRDNGPGLVVLNPLSWARDELAVVPRDAIPSRIIQNHLAWELVDAEGQPLRLQWLEGDPAQTSHPMAALFEARGVPPLGYRVYTWRRRAPIPDEADSAAVLIDDSRLENEHLVVLFDRHGQIRSVYDKDAGRELLPEGALANVLQLFDEDPNRSNAWDIDRSCGNAMRPVDQLASARVIERGPLRVGVELTRVFSQSRLRQRVYLSRGSRRVDFVTEVDWHERNKMLKAAFPLEVRTRHATFDIQFGALERPIHRNTSWDEARHEVWTHKWMDMSEGGYGASLLNDGKYGLDILDNVVRLTLLRAPSSPDPLADEGRHEFTYSLYPHEGDWRQASTVREGHQLNQPLLVRAILSDASTAADRWPSEGWLARVEPAWVILETVKKAEDSQDLVVRLYESEGRRGPTRVRFSRPVLAATECNLMEEEDQAIEHVGDSITFTIRPFEIRTFKVRLA